MVNPGERIDCKKRIAETLAKQAWRDIDLILAEFDVGYDDRWEGSDAETYVLEMLQANRNDEQLAQLEAYLRPKEGPTAPPAPDAFDDVTDPWSGEGFRLFISHVHDNAIQAGALRASLAQRSVDAFVAHDNIAPADSWRDVVLYALRSCDACLALLAPGFRESEWTDQEVGFCLARDKLVIPLEWGLTPYGFLGRSQALPVRKGQNQDDIALAVFELLVRKEASRDEMAKHLVRRWAMSPSFDAARENYGLLNTVPAEAWTASLATEVREARQNNSELRYANIDWRPSEDAVEALFSGTPYAQQTPPPAADPNIPSSTADDIPF